MHFSAFGQSEVEGQVLVQLYSSFDGEVGVAQFLPGFPYSNRVEARIISARFKIILLEFDENDISKKEMIRALNDLPAVEMAQANHRLELRNGIKTPNDSLYHQQWDMDIIRAPEVWNVTTGGLTAQGDTIVVAVIDDGTDFKHRDLQGNLWYNHNEIPNDGMDNDNNGFVDDHKGWSVEVGNDTHPRSEHGTAVSGIVGAKGDNGFGVTGVNWNIKIMVLSRARIESDVLIAYDYILKMREKYNVTNGNSGAYVVATTIQQGFAGNPDNHPLWCGVYDVLGKAGILNVAATVNSPISVDTNKDIPTSCTSPYLITVTNTSQADELRSTAGFGYHSIDLGAPGSGTYTLTHLNKYSTFSGTSAAAPHVAGAIALLYSTPNTLFIENMKANIANAPLQMKQFILDGVDKLPTLQLKVNSEGRLNIYNSYNLLQDYYEGFASEFEVVEVFPNPTSDVLYVNYNTPNSSFEVELYNELGQKITNWRILPQELGTKRLSLDVSLLQTGVYFIQLKNNDIQVVKPFVVLMK